MQLASSELVAGTTSKSKTHNQSERPIDTLNRVLADCLLNKDRIELLEAGGGSNTYIQFDSSKDVAITTIDISSTQLQENKYAKYKILGDICSYEFPPASFDVIVCYDVIEHLENPQAAIASFLSAIKPGGHIVIGAPNPLSLKGIITKFTPHLAHVWLYRVFHNNPDAGKPGCFPYPTWLRFCIAPGNLSKIFRQAGLEVVYVNLYASAVQTVIREKSRILAAAPDGVLSCLRIASGGSYRPELSDFHLIVRKPALRG